MPDYARQWRNGDCNRRASRGCRGRREVVSDLSTGIIALAAVDAPARDPVPVCEPHVYRLAIAHDLRERPPSPLPKTSVTRHSMSCLPEAMNRSARESAVGRPSVSGRSYSTSSAKVQEPRRPVLGQRSRSSGRPRPRPPRRTGPITRSSTSLLPYVAALTAPVDRRLLASIPDGRRR